MPVSVFNAARPPSYRASGFTLIEIMLAVTLIAILASVALPAYSDYARRGQLPEAFGALADYRARMEQYFQDNRSYGSGGACATDASARSWNQFAPVDAKNFRYGCTISDAQQGYTITAAGAAGSAVGHVFTIDHNGVRGTTRFKGEAVAAKCWLTKDIRC